MREKNRGALAELPGELEIEFAKVLLIVIEEMRRRQEEAGGAGIARLAGQAERAIERRGAYADENGHADPRRYAEMVAEDRELRLHGYEVYRFGGAELTDTPATGQRLATFFDRLTERYST